MQRLTLIVALWLIACAPPQDGDVRPEAIHRAPQAVPRHGSGYVDWVEPRTWTVEPPADLQDVVVVDDARAAEALAGVTDLNAHLLITGAIADVGALSSLQRVSGNVVITDATSLDGLQGLESLTWVGGRLVVTNCPLLTSLDGLDGVRFVGTDLVVSDNPALAGELGLPSLERVPGVTRIARMGALTSLGPLRVGEVVGGIELSDLAILEDLDAFSDTTLVTGDVRFTDVAVPDLTGLSQLAVVEGSLDLRRVVWIRDLSGLDALGEIGVDLRIEGPSALETLDGLEGLHRVGRRVTLEGLGALGDVSGLSGLESVTSIDLDDLDGLREVVWPALERVPGMLRLANHRWLNRIAMPALRQVRELWIEDNRALRNFAELGPPADLGSMVLANNAVLVRTGWEGATIVLDGYVAIQDNPELRRLDEARFVGNASQTFVGTSGASLIVTDNPLLVDLEMLRTVRTAVGRVMIKGNSSLPDLAGLRGLRAARTIDLDDNALLTGFDGLRDDLVVADRVSVEGHPLFDDVSWLERISPPPVVRLYANPLLCESTMRALEALYGRAIDHDAAPCVP